MEFNIPTMEECKKLYSTIPQAKRDAAIASFRASPFADAFPTIREAIKKDPENWWVPYHFHWGMNVRNYFRKNGFGEEYFGVDNLDDIYVFLVEEAVKEDDAK
jgi:hypothetical protein